MFFFSPKNLFTKHIVIALILVIVLNLALFAAIFYPQAAHAIPVSIIANVQGAAKWIWEKIADAAKFAWEKTSEAAKFVANKIQNAFENRHILWKELKSTGQGIIPQLLQDLMLVVFHQLMAKITNDIVAWINGGGKGKIRILQDPGQFLRDTLDEAGGIMAGAILNVDPRSLCNADFLKLKLSVAFTGPYAVPTFDEKVACTFSGMSEGLRRFKQDFKEGGWTAFVEYSDKRNNQIGQTLILAQQMEKIKAERSAEGTAKLQIGNGFLGQEECVITELPRSSFRNASIGRQQLGTRNVTPSNPQEAERIRRGIQSGTEIGITTINKSLSNANPDEIQRTLGKKLEEAMKIINFTGNDQEFKGAWVAHGGKYSCKIVTPAQQISDLLSTAVQAPIRKLEAAAASLTKGSPGVVKPYLTAIVNASLNLLVKKEMGLISAVFRPTRRARATTRQNTASLQKNAVRASSAGALSGSLNSFRSSIIDTMVGINSFIVSINSAIEQSNAALGRIAINQAEYEGLPIRPPILMNDATIRAEVFTMDTASEIPTGNSRTLLGSLYAVRDVTGTILTPKKTSTYPPGKVFHDEAKWCGAYAQIIENTPPVVTSRKIQPMSAIDNPVINARRNIGANNDCPKSWKNGAIGTCSATDWIDFGDHQIRIVPTMVYNDISAKGTNSGWANRFVRETRTGGVVVRETIISGFDTNGDDTTNSVILPPGISNATAATSFAILNFKKLFVLNNTHPDIYNPANPGSQGDIHLVTHAPLVANDGTVTGSAQINNIAEGISQTSPVWEKYQSPVFTGGSATLLNFKESIIYYFDVNKKLTVNQSNANVPNATQISSSFTLNENSDLIWLAPPFYPELHEIAQAAMEKARITNGYAYGSGSDVKYYNSALALQLGTTPDDDPLDNNLASGVYVNSDNNGDGLISSPWDNNLKEEGYKGSVNDTLTKYNNLVQLFQTIFAGFEDENVLESIDEKLTILGSQETNIRLALIGSRCPALPPSDGSDLKQACPIFGEGTPDETYNMARRFIFEPNFSLAGTKGLSTGFTTNPFTGQKSSVLSGILNLEEMTDQLQTLSPDKNIVKLIRLRQILEQLQICDGCANSATQISPRPIKIPNRDAFIYPQPLTGVDKITIFIPGYEEIQDYLNDTAKESRNKDIRELIKAYGYITAKEAYPQISQELDDVFDDIVGQVVDKLKAVFLKRVDLELAQAEKNVEHRLIRFIEYARDVNSVIKIESKNNPGLLLSASSAQIRSNTYMIKVDGKDAFGTPAKIEQGLKRDVLGNPLSNTFSDKQRKELVGSGVHKIKTISKFIGIDVSGQNFLDQISKYTTITPTAAPTEAARKIARAVDLDNRLLMALKDVYMLYGGVFDKTNETIPEIERNISPSCQYDSTYGGYYCDLENGGRIYKDAKTKLSELKDDFNLMVQETGNINTDFLDLNTNSSTVNADLKDLFALLNDMVLNYNKANVCIGIPINEDSLWRLPVHLGFASGSVESRPNNWWVFGSALGKRKAQECRDSIKEFNKNLGQLAGKFLCDKVNPIYTDQFENEGATTVTTITTTP